MNIDQRLKENNIIRLGNRNILEDIGDVVITVCFFMFRTLI